MKKLGMRDFREVETWIHRNARPLEVALWQYHFRRGAAEAVLDELAWYQNEDGGFGNRLEPDNWNPESTPYATQFALNMMVSVGAEASHPLVQGVLRFLESGVHRTEHGWLFNVPSNDLHPHAPWWTYSGEANALEGIGITAEFAGHIFTLCPAGSPLYTLALGLADRLFARLDGPGPYGDMGVGGYCKLLEAVKRAGLAGRFDVAALSPKVKQLADGAIVRDTARWAQYGMRPSNLIQSPDSPYYPGNEQIVAAELDYMIDTRPSGEVWGITWSWFDLGPVYPKEFAISENWWRVMKAIDAMLFFRSFGRLEAEAAGHAG